MLLICAEGATAQNAPAAAKSGADIVAAKCGQCHNDSMWREQRQNRRAWEATLYRMVGRGAAWEVEEITAMADYLGSDFGPSVPRAAPASKKQ
jgi:hypothetical protein